MKKYRLLIIIIFVFLGMTSSAQKVLSLDEAIANVLDKNFDIKLAKYDSAVAAIDYSYRNSAFLPQLNGDVGATWNNNNQNITLNNGTKRTGRGIKSSAITSQLALNWTLFDGLKMFATRDKLEKILEVGEIEIRRQMDTTIASVIDNYYNIVRQKQQLRAIEEQMSIDSERVRLAQYRLDIGAGAKPDLLQSKIDLNAQKSAQLQQQSLIGQLREQLNQAMGLPQFSMYDVTDTIIIKRDISLGDVLNYAEKSDPSVKIAATGIDIAKLTLKEAKGDLYPSLSFNSTYNYNRNNNQTVLNPTSPLFTQTNGLNYGLTASIPILNHFNARRSVRQAKWNIQYQGLVYDNTKSVTQLSVINAFQSYEEQKKELDLEDENILLARENLDIVLQMYKLSAATLLQLKEAQQSLQDAYNRLIAARYNAKVSETELLRLSGQLVK